MLQNYIKIALRTLVKSKAYSTINIAGLATGIALCLLILAYVSHELSYDSFHESGDRVVRINMMDEDGEMAVTPSMVAPAIAQRAPEVERWIRVYEPTRYSPVVIKVRNEKFQETSFMYSDSAFFDIFTFTFLNGSPDNALVNPNSLVLTETIANKLFGNLDIIGEIVSAQIFNSDVEFVVTGVIEDVPNNSHFRFDYLGSMNTMSSWSQLTDSEIRSANFYSYMKLHEEASIESLQAKIDGFVESVVKDQRDISLTLIPLRDIYLRSSSDFEIAPMGNMFNIYGFAFLGFMVLIVGIINYINLATARSAKRASEVGIRKAMGAQRIQLVKQFYGESIILTIISVASALILVELFKETFFGILGKEIQLNVLTDPTIWILLASITLITSALSGIYPALLLSSFQPVKVLKGLFGTGIADGKLRKGLVVSQFAISTFLIISTLVIFEQTQYVLSTNLGFDKEAVIVLPARDRQLSTKQDLLKSEILQQPGVLSATYMSNIPGKVFGGYSSEHTPDRERVPTAAGAADRDFIETMGVELIAGEGFTKSDAYSIEQGYQYLLNETLAKKYGWTPEEAISQPFNVLGNREGTIVGVINDFHFASLHQEIEPLALFMNASMHNYLMVKIAPNATLEALASISEVWDEIAPHRPFEFEFLDQQLNALYQNEIQTRNILGLFTGLAIFIACLGLIGLSSFMINQRAKEIGIRKVLGASISNIVQLLSLDFLKLVGIGFLLGAPIAWYMMEEWLSNFASRIDIDVVVFLTCAVVGIVITLVTVSTQSLKAAIANPVDSLKNE